MVSQLRSQVESVLLVVDSPVGAEALASALGVRPEDVVDTLLQWRDELHARGSGIDLRENAEGWRLYTRPENAAAVEAFILDGAQAKLSRAAMETLAVVACLLYTSPSPRDS